MKGLRHKALLPVVLLAGAAIFASAALADVKDEYRFETGTCGGGTAWWTVTTYRAGCPVVIEGVDCYGRPFAFWPGCATVATDPTIGQEPTHIGICSGGVSSFWHAVLHYDADTHRPDWIGGETCDGRYYLATTFEDREQSDGDLR